MGAYSLCETGPLHGRHECSEAGHREPEKLYRSCSSSRRGMPVRCFAGCPRLPSTRIATLVEFCGPGFGRGPVHALARTFQIGAMLPRRWV